VEQLADAIKIFIAQIVDLAGVAVTNTVLPVVVVPVA
jgi:phosphoribosylcarboxyaminoimidazole (NCAIR) mutase